VKDKRRPPANDDGRGCRRPAGRVVCRDVSGDAYLVELWVDGTRPWPVTRLECRPATRIQAAAKVVPLRSA